MFRTKSHTPRVTLQKSPQDTEPHVTGMNPSNITGKAYTMTTMRALGALNPIGLRRCLKSVRSFSCIVAPDAHPEADEVAEALKTRHWTGLPCCSRPLQDTVAWAVYGEPLNFARPCSPKGFNDQWRNSGGSRGKPFQKLFISGVLSTLLIPCRFL